VNILRKVTVCAFIALSLSCSVAEPLVYHPSVSESSLVVLPCTSIQQWVSVAPQEDGFVYAAGSAVVRYEPLATAIQQAQENARAELSKQLMVRIEANTEVSTVRRRTESGVNDTTTLRDRVISNAPQIDLPGLEIVERCIDQRKDTVFALARLNRRKATDGLTQQIAQLDEEIGRYMSIPSGIPKTEQIRQIFPALDLINKRKKLERMLNYVSGYPPAVAVKSGRSGFPYKPARSCRYSARISVADALCHRSGDLLRLRQW